MTNPDRIVIAGSGFFFEDIGLCRGYRGNRKRHGFRLPDRRNSRRVTNPENSHTMNDMNLTVLGIDPGTQVTGYGVIAVKEGQIHCLDYGTLTLPGRPDLTDRLCFINKGLKKLYQTYRPRHTAVEKVFFGRNPQTAFKLGHVFALCLVRSRESGSLFFEYPARFVKKAVTSSGRADKNWTRLFVNNFLSLHDQKPLDATDALAVALCHLRQQQKQRLQKEAVKEAAR